MKNVSLKDLSESQLKKLIESNRQTETTLINYDKEAYEEALLDREAYKESVRPREDDNDKIEKVPNYCSARAFNGKPIDVAISHLQSLKEQYKDEFPKYDEVTITIGLSGIRDDTDNVYLFLEGHKREDDAQILARLQKEENERNNLKQEKERRVIERKRAQLAKLQKELGNEE